MMDVKQVSTYVARGRVGLGLAAMVAPGLALGSMLGRSVNNPGARAVGRLMGVRDAVLGAGGSIATGQQAGGGDWLSMMALCDGFDALVLLTTPGLAKRARLIGVGAAGSAVFHLYLARELAAQEQTETRIT
jgi:hypothetical protein